MKVISSWQLKTKNSPDTARLEQLITEAANLAGTGLGNNEILSVNFLGADAMRKLNLDFLNHDYLTDVICFDYRNTPDYMEGEDAAVEIFISPDIAAERAADDTSLDYSSEVMLYLVHALLHAAGLKDKSEVEKCEMRRREKDVIDALLEKKFLPENIF